MHFSVLSLKVIPWLDHGVFSFLQIAILFTSISFISYGSSCLFSQTMKREFERYQLKDLRILTGLLQILASLVLLLGLMNPIFAIGGAVFLSIMMFVALWVRIRIRDPWFLMLPALFYFALNFYISLIASSPFF